MRVDERSECIEEPSMTVELLLVLFLQAENNLDGARTRRDLARVGDDDVGGVPAHLAQYWARHPALVEGLLENVGSNILSRH